LTQRCPFVCLKVAKLAGEKLDTADLSGVNCLYVDCMEILSERCPLLENLTINFMASDTSLLPKVCEPRFVFPRLRCLNLDYSFYNHKYDKFVRLRAAKYLGNYINESTRVLWEPTVDDYVEIGHEARDGIDEERELNFLFYDFREDLKTLMNELVKGIADRAIERFPARKLLEPFVPRR
jgi:hypothetical protein